MSTVEAPRVWDIATAAPGHRPTLVRLLDRVSRSAAHILAESLDPGARGARVLCARDRALSLRKILARKEEGRTWKLLVCLQTGY